MAKIRGKISLLQLTKNKELITSVSTKSDLEVKLRLGSSFSFSDHALLSPLNSHNLHQYSELSGASNYATVKIYIKIIILYSSND